METSSLNGRHLLNEDAEGVEVCNAEHYDLTSPVSGIGCLRLSDAHPATYPHNRSDDFANISRVLGTHSFLTTERCVIALGDSLKILRDMPSGSVSLILTDPPYHSTKKENIYGDTAFKADRDYLHWMQQFFQEWRRILRPNGSLLMFCATPMAARLEVKMSEYFNMLSHIVWSKPNEPGFDGWKGKMRKESLRQWYAHSERVLFAEPAVEGNIFRCPLGVFLRSMRKMAGLSGHQLTAMTGDYGKVNHGGAVSNWEAGRNTPSKEQYNRICVALQSTGQVPWMPAYEDVVRPFVMDSTKQFTDIWDFESVRPYAGKHPAEKPMDLLMHAVEATTYPEDVVLDCFQGSGSTIEAALRLGRRAIGIDIEEKWVHESARRALLVPDSTDSKLTLPTKKQRRAKVQLQGSLLAD